MSRVIKSSLVIESSYEENKLEEKINNKQLVKRKTEILDQAKKKHNKIINDAKIEAEKIINSAKNTSEKILEETYDRSTEIISEYKDKGYQEGYNKGYEEGKQESEIIINEAVSIKKETVKSKEAMVESLEKDIIEIVISSCSKIINRLYDEDREVILSIIQKGLDNLNNSLKIIIKVSKDDYDFLQMYQNKINAMANSVDKIEVVTDKNLEKGGILIESPKGSIDVGINTQIKELEKYLRGLLNSE